MIYRAELSQQVLRQLGGFPANAFTAFGWESNAAFWQSSYEAVGAPPVPDSLRGLAALHTAFAGHGCTMRGRAEYDVRYWLSDLDSFVFFVKAIPLPEQFDPLTHCGAVNRAISASGCARGIQTNEHRLLLIEEKLS